MDLLVKVPLDMLSVAPRRGSNLVIFTSTGATARKVRIVGFPMRLVSMRCSKRGKFTALSHCSCWRSESSCVCCDHQRSQLSLWQTCTLRSTESLSGLRDSPWKVINMGVLVAASHVCSWGLRARTTCVPIPSPCWFIYRIPPAFTERQRPRRLMRGRSRPVLLGG